MYKVIFVADSELPEGVDYAVVRKRGGGMVAYIKESAISPQMLERAWAEAVRCELSGSTERVAQLITGAA